MSTTTIGYRWKLDVAAAAAEHFMALWADTCEQAMIAGSIRRKRAMDPARRGRVGDIEFLALPICDEVPVAAVPAQLDLFGAATGGSQASTKRVSRLDTRLEQLAAQGILFKDRPNNTGKGLWGEKQKKFWIKAQYSDGVGYIAVDLFIVTPPAEWGSLLIIRTGPKDFEKALMGYINAWTNLQQHDGRLIVRETGVTVPTPTEESYFKVIGLPYVEPHKRTADWANKWRRMRRAPVVYRTPSSTALSGNRFQIGEETAGKTEYSSSGVLGSGRKGDVSGQDWGSSWERTGLPPIYGIGYGGRSLDSIKREVERLDAYLIDIRLSTYSRNPDFCRSNLRAIFGDRYHPITELGNLNYETGGPHKLKDYALGLKRLRRLGLDRPMILMCGCKDPDRCHRTTVLNRMAEDGFTTSEIGPAISHPTIKAITIHQPWASLIAAGVKEYETRHWSTNYRGLIAIHAGKKQPDIFYDDFDFQWDDPGYHLPDPPPLGSIVAIARLVTVVPSEQLVDEGELSDLERELGNFNSGRYGWKLEIVKAFDTPISVRGQQGLWDWAGWDGVIDEKPGKLDGSAWIFSNGKDCPDCERLAHQAGEQVSAPVAGSDPGAEVLSTRIRRELAKLPGAHPTVLVRRLGCDPADFWPVVRTLKGMGAVTENHWGGLTLI